MTNKLGSAADWAKAAPAILLALAAFINSLQKADAETVQANRQTIESNCSDIDGLKALARELISIAPIDPDTPPEERRRYEAKAYALTRPDPNC